MNNNTNIFESILNQRTESAGHKIARVVSHGFPTTETETESGVITTTDRNTYRVTLNIDGTEKNVDYSVKYANVFVYAIESMGRQNDLDGFKHSEILDFYKKHDLDVWVEKKVSDKGNPYFTYKFAEPKAKI